MPRPHQSSQTERLALIRLLHDDHAIPLPDRVVGLLILLYAQPLIKIARLAVAVADVDDGEVWRRLGTAEPVPIIPPFSDLLLAYITTRSNRTTANQPRQHAAIPRPPSRPTHPPRSLRLQRLGIPNLNGRTRWDGRRAEPLKIRHRIGHLRRPHPDDLDRLEQTLRDLDQGALKALRAYQGGHDPKLIAAEDDPVVSAWVDGEHDDAQRLIKHAESNYDTNINLTLTARPWANLPQGNDRLHVALNTPGFVWRVGFYMRVDM